MHMQLSYIILEHNKIPLKQLCRIVAKFLPQASYAYLDEVLTNPDKVI